MADETTQTQASTETKPVAPAVPPVVGPTTVQLTTAEYQSLVADRASFQAAQAEANRAREEAESARAKALIEKGQIEEGWKLQKETYEARISQERAEKERLAAERLADRKEAVIGRILTGVPFREEASGLASRHIASELVAERTTDGEIIVVHRTTRKPAAEWVKEWLASPEGKIFLNPTTQGGSSQTTGNQTSQTQVPTSYANLGEAVMSEFLKRTSGAGQSPSGLRPIRN